MKIAQIAPLYESCPPKGYGGTERVVSYLTEELVELGHEVTLFASGDSVTAARLIASCPRSIRLSGSEVDGLAYHAIMFHDVLERIGEFDVLHFHTDYLHFPTFERDAAKTVTTMHGRLDAPTMSELLSTFSMMPLVSISNSQRLPVPNANFVRTIYHGLPSNASEAGNGEGGYLAFVGRISPEKRPDRAFAIAKGAGVPLHVAAKIDPVDQDYYATEIAPLFDDKLVTFVGEIGDDQKGSFFGGARALLFPIDWPEPFGLVMIEAMAVGTPTIAFRHGSVEEIIEDGVTGFVVDTVDEAIAAVAKLPELDRATIRRRCEERFSIRRVAENYVALYRDLVLGTLAA